MKRFRVCVERIVTSVEWGYVEIDAEGPYEAREKVYQGYDEGEIEIDFDRSETLDVQGIETTDVDEIEVRRTLDGGVYTGN